MKYRFLILIFTLISNSLYSQNDLRIFVGTIYGGNYGYTKTSWGLGGQTMDTERERGSVGPICRGIVLTVDSSSGSVVTNFFPLMWNGTNDNPRDLKSIDPIINTSEILSFNFSYGKKSTDYVDFYFDKKENLITLTKHIFKFDGTDETSTVKYYGFTRDQLDNPSNDIEIEGSKWFQPRLVKEQFYNLYNSNYNNPYHEKYGGNVEIDKMRHTTISSLDKTSELVKFYNEHPILDRDSRTREFLISFLNSKPFLVGIPENLIREISKYEDISLPFFLQEKVDILYSPKQKSLSWIVPHENGRDFKRINISNSVDYDYTSQDTTYIVRDGNNSFSEEKLSFHSVFDSYTVKLESEVIDTFITGTSQLPYLIVSKKKKEIIWLKYKSDYVKKKKKYVDGKYKVYEVYSDLDFLYGPNHGPYPGYDMDNYYIVEVNKVTVMLNNIKVGTAIVGRKISRESLLE